MKSLGGENGRPGHQAIFVQDGPGARLSLILSIFALIAAIVAIVVVIASFSGATKETVQTAATDTNKETDSSKQTEVASTTSSKIWYFGYPNAYQPYSYTNGDKLRGLSLKIVDAVCQEAGKKCKHLLVQSQFCYDRKTSHGEALLGNWVDVCVGYFKTIERVNVFSSFAPLYSRVTSRMLAKTDTFRLNELQNKKIGMIAGDHADDYCLAQKSITLNSVTEYPTVAAAIKDLESAKLDALFLAKYNEDLVENPSQYPSVQGGEQLYCSIDGAGLLARKGSSVESWFPPALEQIRDTGVMEAYCRDSLSEFGKPADCVLNRIQP